MSKINMFQAWREQYVMVWSISLCVYSIPQEVSLYECSRRYNTILTQYYISYWFYRIVINKRCDYNAMYQKIIIKNVVYGSDGPLSPGLEQEALIES